MTGKKRESLVVKATDNGIKINNKNVGGLVLDGFYNLWKDKLLCDVKLMCHNEEIYAHRSMLLIYSDYFKAMFTIGLSESSQSMPHIQLDEASPEALKSLLLYMYTGSLSVTNDTVQDLIVLTDLLQMRDVKEQCFLYMEKSLDVTNCLGMWDFAETYGSTTLLVKAICLVKRRFPVIVKTEEFLNISSSRLGKILKFEDLSLGNNGEDDVFKGVVRWLEHDVTERIDCFKDMLKLVKLIHVSSQVINELKQMMFMQENLDIMTSINFRRSTDKDCPPRHPIQCIYVVGGYLQSRTGPMCPRLKTVERYNFKDNVWKQSETLPVLASGVQVFNIHGKLFTTSFEMSHGDSLMPYVSSTPGFYEYDNIQNIWKDANYCFAPSAAKVIHDCLQKSGSLAVCPRTNKIYIMSETDIYCIDSTVNDGEVSFSEAEQLPSLQELESYSNHATVLHKDDLYVLGGDRRISASEIFPVASVFMFDCSENKWITKTSMQEPRARFSAVVMDDYIYAVGGFNSRRLRSVERYDPVTDTWRYIESMNKERSHFKCLVHLYKIYAMGGKSYSRYEGGARKVLSSCEVYDPETDMWTYTAPMNQARCLFGAELF
ncbi:kelch-like protein 12 [Mytilus edulis]|uniref:kelch-like protein 12 n=1 Tax=Mytilus edulis TaxID=6550 RepID=UPI0039EEC90D